MNIHNLSDLDEVLKYGLLGEIIITSTSGWKHLESMIESYWGEKESPEEAYDRGYNDGREDTKKYYYEED